jgi:DNA mismatch repair ATPase MutS
VGEFYETYGVDAIMLVNYCGLNPMGNRAKAGFPIRSIQPALDSLTSEGFSIAVFEEMKDVCSKKLIQLIHFLSVNFYYYFLNRT